MSNLSEQNFFDPGVYQINTTDAVIGGAVTNSSGINSGGAVANYAAQNLTNRTRWLYNALTALSSTPLAPLPQLGAGVGQWSAPIFVPGTSGTVTLPAGGTWAYFIFGGDVSYQASYTGIAAGGSVVLTAASVYGGTGTVIDMGGFCWRIQ